jgi:heat shock protein HslJ
LLESIEGKEIIYPADYKQNFVIFTGEAEGFELSGFAGCNNFKGKYDVGDHETIGIEKIMSTKKACSFIDLENNFFRVLNGVDTYKIEGYYMTFYKEGKEIAFFKNNKKHN